MFLICNESHIPQSLLHYQTSIFIVALYSVICKAAAKRSEQVFTYPQKHPEAPLMFDIQLLSVHNTGGSALQPQDNRWSFLYFYCLKLHFISISFLIISLCRKLLFYSCQFPLPPIFYYMQYIMTLSAHIYARRLVSMLQYKNGSNTKRI